MEKDIRNYRIREANLSFKFRQMCSPGGGFKYFLFSPLLGEDVQFDEHIFQMGWFKPPTSIYLGFVDDPSL